MDLSVQIEIVVDLPFPKKNGAFLWIIYPSKTPPAYALGDGQIGDASKLSSCSQ